MSGIFVVLDYIFNKIVLPIFLILVFVYLLRVLNNANRYLIQKMNNTDINK